MSAPRWTLLGLGLACLMATPGALLSAEPPALLILPFENTAEDPSLGWLSAGLAQHTGEDLRGYGCQIVEDEERAVLLEGRGIPAGAPLTLASALDLARRMRVRSPGLRPGHLILGRFNVVEGEVTLSARVINLESEKARPWLSRQGRLRDLLEVHDDLIVALTRDADLRPARRSTRSHNRSPDPPLLAFETYSRAMAETDSKKRLGLLRRALQEFPGYPTASYQAALVLARSEKWDDATEILKASATDAHPYEAEFHLLAASLALHRRDSAAAAQAARESLTYAESARAHALLGRALVAQGDIEAARGEWRRAQELDPGDGEIEELGKLLKQDAPPAGRTP